MERSLLVAQRCRELGSENVALAHSLDERREALQHLAMVLVGIEDSHRQAEFLSHNPNRFSEV